jgi:hypothetical protein
MVAELNLRPPEKPRGGAALTTDREAPVFGRYYRPPAQDASAADPRNKVAIRDYIMPVRQIGGRQGVGDEITRRADVARENSCRPDCLLDHIDAEVGRKPPDCYLLSNCCLARSW